MVTYFHMIKNIKHKGLRELFETDRSHGVKKSHVPRLRRILSRLNVSSNPIDMRLPGFDFKELHGPLKGIYQVTVNGNWRVRFRFDNGCAVDVDYDDFH